MAALVLFLGTLPTTARASDEPHSSPPVAPVGNGAVVDEAGVVFPIVEDLPEGRIVTTPCAAEIVLEEGTYLAGVDVVLDPGHGGPESGAVGANGLIERELNLRIALLAELELESLGYSVELTRRSDLHMPIRQRSAIANALSPRAFVSIHHNGGAIRRSDTPGTESFHQIGSSESRRLAGLIFEEIHATFVKYWVPWVATAHQGASSRLKSAGVDAYGVLRYTPGIPSVISEAVYLSNPGEAILMALPTAQVEEAQALARAIHRFISTSDPGSGFNAPFIDGVMTGTGTGKGCVDSDHGSHSEITVAYTASEHAALTNAAASRGSTIRDFQVFGVHALDFVRRQNGNEVRPLAPDSVPNITGSVVELVRWTPTERVALTRVAKAYGLTAGQAQKLGGRFMVFLTSLDG